jgi:hypothetical protein
VGAFPFAVWRWCCPRRTLETNKGSLTSTSLCEVSLSLSLSLSIVGPQEVSPQYGGGGGMVVVEGSAEDIG